MSKELVSKFSPEEAREFIEEVKGDYGALRTKIATMWKGRIWLALGYESWQECIDTEFANEPIRPPKKLEQETIDELRSLGMSTREIATATDIPKSTVARRFESSTVPYGTVDDDERVVGLDGKSRSATQPSSPSADGAEDVVDAEVVADEGCPNPLVSDLGIEPIDVSLDDRDGLLSAAQIVQLVNDLHAGTRKPLPQVKRRSRLVEDVFALGLAKSNHFEDEQVTELGRDVADAVVVLSDLLTAMNGSDSTIRALLKDEDTVGSMRKAVKNLTMITGDRK
ncbi:hypothetical protein [Brevibacterium aurantiacum]|uniref:Uncharacterized protein n=1 Tax=Brevibacterium aurantiacum TaxID=273384 RepID=A0A3Q9NPF3_BREAU|nr:hypothetical protein [Brevibacterium aurantiacum]AZT92080.1 hypothetical protein CXR23_02075 [Brevibacterium aurantiacum]